MDFPCSYPLKVKGEEHGASLFNGECHHRETCPGGRGLPTPTGSAAVTSFLSPITATFSAESQEQLTAIYRELNDHKLVLFTL